VSVKKHRIKYTSKIGIVLAVLKAFREFLLAVRVLGLLLAFTPSATTHTSKHTINKRK
jgi:hypothetical protein